jgi:two-component system, chemotaxis family, response regulator Rcp1
MCDLADCKSIEVLLVEDNPGDIRLIKEALNDAKIHVHITVARDGVEALELLRREGNYATAVVPDLILLDLNLPRMSGHDVLATIKQDEGLRRIPVVIVTSSKADQDIAASYDLHANCFVTKPVDLDQFFNVVQAIREFWFVIVKLPRPQAAGGSAEL